MKAVKITAVLLCLAAAVVFAAFFGFAAEYKTGDVDCDGDVDYDDAYLIFNYASGNGKLDFSQLDRADINGDGIVTVIDAAQLFHFVNGIFAELPYKQKGKGFLSILSYPDKTEYTEGEELDMTGFVLRADYENGKVEYPTDYTYTGYSPASGVKIIIVTCQGAKTAFTVTVYPAETVAVEILSLPKKVVYKEGESLDLAGLRVSAVMKDGRKKEITAYSVEGFESTVGEHVITITYRGYKASFTIKVEE